MERRLYRSQHNRVLLGVCGGLGEYFNVDPVIVRVIWIVVTLATAVFPGILAYFIVALVIPLEGSTASTPRDNMRETVTDIKDTANSLRDEVKTSFAPKDSTTYSTGQPQPLTPRQQQNTGNHAALYVLGIIIIALGVLILLWNIFHTWLFWSGLLIAAGIIILLLTWRRPRP
jgi:phage shock protein C